MHGSGRGRRASFLPGKIGEDEVRNRGFSLWGVPVDSLEELLVDYRRLMGEVGYQSAGWVAPNNPEVLPVLERAGFQRSWDKSLYVYELKLE